MGFGKRLLGWFGVILALALAIAIGYMMERFPPNKVGNCSHNDHKFKSKVGLPWSISQDNNYRRLKGFPYKCGWQELRPGDKKAKLFAYIQPGSFCWSNAGVVGPIGGGLGGGVLIDTLMDEQLTRSMLRSRNRDTGVGFAHLQALFYTHPDVDHILGSNAVGFKVSRWGRKEVDDEMKYLKANKAQMVAMSMIGHYVYAALKESGVQTWIHDLPDPLKEVMVKLLGWGWFQSRIAEFNLHEIDAKLFAKISDEGMIDNPTHTVRGIHGVGKIVVRHYGAIHSSSDSAVFFPDSQVVYTGDLLFIGIAPIMWAGPSSAWVEALDKLLAETEQKEEGWLFVPGHGPVTDAKGVKFVKKYMQYVNTTVAEKCDWEDKDKDGECALKVLNGLPHDLRDGFDEPQRVLVTAQVDCMARRNKGTPVKVDVMKKVALLSGQGEYAVRDILGLAKEAEAKVAR